MPDNDMFNAFRERLIPDYNYHDKRKRNAARLCWIEGNPDMPPPWLMPSERTQWFQARSAERMRAEQLENMALPSWVCTRIDELERRLAELKSHVTRKCRP